MIESSIGKPLNEWSRQDIKDYHQKISTTEMGQSPWVTWNFGSDANIMPSLEGIDRISRKLIENKKLPVGALCVCESLSAFCEALKAFPSQIPADGRLRRAFLVPTHSSKWGKNREGVVAKRSEEFYQHLVLVGVEAKNGLLQIALLDPMICYGNESLDPDHIGLGPKYEEKPFTEQELILSHILEANLNPSTTLLYHSEVLRQKTNGCWAFAIKDALAFLRDTEFFNNIEVANVMIRIGNYTLSPIKTLPASFMLGAQYTSDMFGCHLTLHPEHDSPEIRRKLEKHRIENLNFRIGHATVKWLQLLEQEWVNSTVLT